MGLIFILLLALPALAQESEPAPVFRGGVTMVHLDVQVVDGRRILSELDRDDFTVFDENQPQRISYFGRTTDPIVLVLLLDVSGSVTRYLEEIAGTARQALQALEPRDRVAVMLFTRQSKVFEEFTSEWSRIEGSLHDAVRTKDLGGGTNINGAIIDAARFIDERSGKPGGNGTIQGRRAILVVTDNQALHYKVPDEEAIRALYAADTVLNAIVVGKAERPRPPKAGQYRNPDFTPADVFRLADATGGEAVRAGSAGESFREMLERIRTRYTVQYVAPEAPAGRYRHVRVSLTDAARKKYPRAEVRGRGGYYASE